VVVDVSVINTLICAVVDGVVVLGVDETCCDGLVLDARGPVVISLVAGVAVEARCELEESPVRDRVLVGVSGAGGEDLPFQAATASVACEVPAADIVVEYVVADDEPGWVGGRWFAEGVFGGGHGGEGPEGDVVVSLR
jgi:hypothetical protein